MLALIVTLLVTYAVVGALCWAAGADRRTREQCVPLDDLLPESRRYNAETEAISRQRHPGGRDRL